MAQITTELLPLLLPDPFPPFLVNIINLGADSLILNVGPAPGPFAISHDFACAMPSRTTAFPPSSTSLSKSSSTSLSLSSKLSKRYQRQIFLSLDLSSVAAQGGPSADHIILPLERALLGKLDPLYKKK